MMGLARLQETKRQHASSLFRLQGADSSFAAAAKAAEIANAIQWYGAG
jgi:hypothetical protein